MSQRVKRTQRDYTLAFKQAVVDQVESGEMRYKEAQSHYGIQGRSTVLAWLCRYGRQNWSAGTPDTLPRSPAMPSRLLTPEQRIKELEEQLRVSQMKAQFFEEVVKVLEKDYGVSVKKAARQVLTRACVAGLSISGTCRFLGVPRPELTPLSACPTTGGGVKS